MKNDGHTAKDIAKFPGDKPRHPISVPSQRSCLGPDGYPQADLAANSAAVMIAFSCSGVFHGEW
jgi:hypothetical protein